MIKRLPHLALVTASCFALHCLGACSPKPDGGEEDSLAITRLDAAEAAASFRATVESALPLRIADRATSAISRKNVRGPGKQIVYTFPDLGNSSSAIPLMGELLKGYTAVANDKAWMPWEELIDLDRSDPGPYMAAYENGRSRLTLWVDRHAQDLFICYEDLPPEAGPTEGQ